MSGYYIQVNQYTGGPTGHVNLTYVGPGINVTYGNNLSPGLGVQLEDYKLADETLTSIQIPLSQEDFSRSLNFARAADLLNNSYFGLCNNCVDFANQALKTAGLGEWAIGDFLKDGSLVDTYAKVSEYICRSDYVDRGTSAVLNILASTSNLNDAVQFVNAMSWLVDHENGSDFYADASNYLFADPNINPDTEADYRLDLLSYYATKLGISVDYDPISEKVTLGVASPIVIDLNGDGIKTTSYSTHSVDFDIDGDGLADRTAWLSGNDAFLAIDANHNGKIDGVRELFGGMNRGDGYAKLSGYDSNRDGRVSIHDDRFLELLIWQDTNMNGTTEEGELQSAMAAGLEYVDTEYKSQKVYQNNNLLGEVSNASWQGRLVETIDVYFRYQPNSELTSQSTAYPVLG